MANELRAYLPTGSTLYAVLINSAGQIWNTSGTPAFEAYNGANWTDYDIALTEVGAGLYFGNMPAAVAGNYSYVVYERAGANPATTDSINGMGTLSWDGSAEVGLANVILNAIQGAITWAQQKIVANVANEGALDIRNANAAGHGTLNDGGNVGLYNSGASVGQYNFGTANYGVQNTGASGQVNVGTAGDGIYASGTDHGVEVTGTVSALSDNILSEFFSIDSGETSATAIDGSVVKEIMDGICTPTVFPAGAISYTYTLTNSTTLLPVEGAEVWFSTDNPAVNIVWKGDTDAFGVARDVLGNLPQLDAGVYFVWAQLAGYSANAWPDTETVS